jgi:hypothetical protein
VVVEAVVMAIKALPHKEVEMVDLAVVQLTPVVIHQYLHSLVEKVHRQVSLVLVYMVQMALLGGLVEDRYTGGGGGAGGTAPEGSSQAGGPGIGNTITGSEVFYGGGGGGGYGSWTGTSYHPAGAGGSGGGGAGSNTTTGTFGTTNTGGGGGGGAMTNAGSSYPHSGGYGGSGIVIVQYDAFTSAVNPTLVSTATTALSAPTRARIILHEQATGTITIGTDIKAYASRDNGTTYTELPLTLRGTYESGKRIIAGNVDISAQPSGTAMRYKVRGFNTTASKYFVLHSACLTWG